MLDATESRFVVSINVGFAAVYDSDGFVADLFKLAVGLSVSLLN